MTRMLTSENYERKQHQRQFLIYLKVMHCNKCSENQASAVKVIFSHTVKYQHGCREKINFTSDDNNLLNCNMATTRNFVGIPK